MAAAPCHVTKCGRQNYDRKTFGCGCNSGGAILYSTDTGDALKSEDDALKFEDERILCKAILGHSLREIFSNKRIQLAVNRCSMERLNTWLASTDVCEIFSIERVAGVCKKFGLSRLGSQWT